MPFNAVLKELQRSSAGAAMVTANSSTSTGTISSSASPSTERAESTSTTTNDATVGTITANNLPTNCTPVTTNNQHSSASCIVNTSNNCSNKVNHHQISPCTTSSLEKGSCKSMTVSNGGLHNKITGNSSHAHLFQHLPDTNVHPHLLHPHHLHHSLTGPSCLPGTLVVASSTGTSVVPSVVPVAINLQLTPSDLLRSAATSGDFDQVKELCKQSVTIDADSEGRTALHYASVSGHLQIVKEIINAGAKVNVKDAVSSSLAIKRPAT